MSNPIIVRATNNIRVVNGKKDPSKRYGFQTFGLQVAEGMFESFDQMFDADKPHFLPPGDYQVVEKGGYLDRDRRFHLGKEFIPVKLKA